MYNKSELTPKQWAWRQKCLKFIENHCTLNEPAIWLTDREDGVYEDDGNLHIIQQDLMACFSIGQDTPAKEANDLMREILEGLKIKAKSYKSENVFIGCMELYCDGQLDTEGICIDCGWYEGREEECCGECGRSGW